MQTLKAAKSALRPAIESSAVATISAQCATYTRLGLVFQVQTFSVLSSSSPLSRAQYPDIGIDALHTCTKVQLCYAGTLSCRRLSALPIESKVFCILASQIALEHLSES